MERFSGTCKLLGEVNPALQVAWLSFIPLSEWPQQDRMNREYPYPAMVSNPKWHDFHAATDPLVSTIMDKWFPGLPTTHRMLSIVMPGQKIAAHDDVQADNWLGRVHVPLQTNPNAIMNIGDESFNMKLNNAYLINTEIIHSLANYGSEPRVHLFWDIIKPE